MGRGAGNCRTEDLLSVFISENKLNLNCLIPILNLIDLEWRDYFNKFQWGPNPYYYLAAKKQIHPTVIQDMMRDESYSAPDRVEVISSISKSDNIAKKSYKLLLI